ncbi:MAG: HlyC/CorC family transporter [Bacteroidales bacterium]|nr:HlyC/CorC family transporter [Bacteroidales bacterium]
MVLLFIYLFIALFVSFLCSIMEAVLLSTPVAYLMVKQEKGSVWAKGFIDLKNNVDKPLSAILSLNTVAHTIGAAGVGAQAVAIFGEIYFGLISAILTVLILVLSEIIPKTIGAIYWKELSKISAKTMRIMIVVSYPLVVLSAFITNLISKNSPDQTTSREEIAVLADIGADEGLFSSKEHKIIQNILRLKNVKAKEIMTPRVVVAVADEEQYLSDFFKNKEILKFSRIPIYSEEEENITGYVFTQQVFEKLAEDKHDLKLKDIIREIVVVPNSIVLFALWEDLLEKNEHIALILDEYGGLDGIVTMEDIIETLLGLEIVDEKDTVTDMQKYAKDRWTKKRAEFNMRYKLEMQQREKKENQERENRESAEELEGND